MPNLSSSQCTLIDKGGRLDFLGSYAADHVDGGLLARELVRTFGFIDDHDHLSGIGDGNDIDGIYY